MDTFLVPSITCEQSTHQCQCFDFTLAFSQKFLGKCITVQIVIVKDHYFCLALNCQQINDLICYYIITQMSDLDPSWTSCIYYLTVIWLAVLTATVQVCVCGGGGGIDN